MNVGVVIVTHGETGQSLLAEARFILDRQLDDIRTIAFNQSGDINGGMEEISKIIRQTDTGDGILVLTDLFGSSPTNRVSQLLEDHNAVMVTGVNLGMLISVCNYRAEKLEFLAQKAMQGGRNAVDIIRK